MPTLVRTASIIQDSALPEAAIIIAVHAMETMLKMNCEASKIKGGSIAAQAAAAGATVARGGGTPEEAAAAAAHAARSGGGDDADIQVAAGEARAAVVAEQRGTSTHAQAPNALRGKCAAGGAKPDSVAYEAGSIGKAIVAEGGTAAEAAECAFDFVMDRCDDPTNAYKAAIGVIVAATSAQGGAAAEAAEAAAEWQRSNYGSDADAQKASGLAAGAAVTAAGGTAEESATAAAQGAAGATRDEVAQIAGEAAGAAVLSLGGNRAAAQKAAGLAAGAAVTAAGGTAEESATAAAQGAAGATQDEVAQIAGEAAGAAVLSLGVSKEEAGRAAGAAARLHGMDHSDWLHNIDDWMGPSLSKSILEPGWSDDSLQTGDVDLPESEHKDRLGMTLAYILDFADLDSASHIQWVASASVTCEDKSWWEAQVSLWWFWIATLMVIPTDLPSSNDAGGHLLYEWRETCRGDDVSASLLIGSIFALKRCLELDPKNRQAWVQLSDALHVARVRMSPSSDYFKRHMEWQETMQARYDLVDHPGGQTWLLSPDPARGKKKRIPADRSELAGGCGSCFGAPGCREEVPLYLMPPHPIEMPFQAITYHHIILPHKNRLRSCAIPADSEGSALPTWIDVLLGAVITLSALAAARASSRVVLVVTMRRRRWNMWRLQQGVGRPSLQATYL